ncbi:hypothetical protein ESCCO14588_5163 [Escherichia coli O157:H7 str. TW14588]|nr:hypothetical protein ESCCO14588_5163 [Escherichia coli O157:H7 str. TW14588]
MLFTLTVKQEKSLRRKQFFRIRQCVTCDFTATKQARQLL